MFINDHVSIMDNRPMLVCQTYLFLLGKIDVSDYNFSSVVVLGQFVTNDRFWSLEQVHFTDWQATFLLCQTGQKKINIGTRKSM